MDISSLSQEDLIQLVFDLKAENERLKGDSITDDLTGLFSMKYAEAEIQSLLQLLPPPLAKDRRGRHRLECVTVVFCDVDDLKVANDTIGHDFGDQLIKTIATTLSHNVRDMDTVARRSGDEMLIVLPDMDEGGVADKIVFLQSKISEIQLKDDLAFNVSVSMGSATAHANDGFRQLVGAAEKAMYVDKHARKKGRVR